MSRGCVRLGSRASAQSTPNKCADLGTPHLKHVGTAHWTSLQMVPDYDGDDYDDVCCMADDEDDDDDDAADDDADV